MEFNTQELLLANAVLTKAIGMKAAAKALVMKEMIEKGITGSMQAWDVQHPTAMYLESALQEIREVAQFIRR